MTSIKICGMRRPEDIEMINRYLPDYAGFIMAPPFWRYVDADTVRSLRQMMDPRIQAVGVFVDQSPAEVAALLNDGVIDIAQLHGQEDNAYMDELRGLTDKEIWKAFRIKGPEDIKRADASHADRILLDGGTGSGRKFNWELLRDVCRPYFLAGGLDPDNAEQAVRMLHPAGVDVSSGVETDTCKDEDKIRRFVDAVRRVL